MSQIRLFIDEDAAEHALIESLRARGVDLLTVVEAGTSGEEDDAQLALATSQDRTFYTLNVGDFCLLHKQLLSEGKEHAGIIVIPRQRYSRGEKIRRLIELISLVTAEEMRNRLEFL